MLYLHPLSPLLLAVVLQLTALCLTAFVLLLMLLVLLVSSSIISSIIIISSSSSRTPAFRGALAAHLSEEALL